MAAALHGNARRIGGPSGIQEPIPSPVWIWHRWRRLRTGFGSPRRDLSPFVGWAKRKRAHHLFASALPERWARCALPPLRPTFTSSRRDLLRALERRARHAAVDIGVERRP